MNCRGGEGPAAPGHCAAPPGSGTPSRGRRGFEGSSLARKAERKLIGRSAGVVESLDTGDLKSPGSNSLAGSSPAPGTRQTHIREGLTGFLGSAVPFAFGVETPRLCRNCATSGQKRECRKEDHASLLIGNTFLLSACSCRKRWIFSMPSSMARRSAIAYRRYTDSVLWPVILMATLRDTPAISRRRTAVLLRS